MSFNTNIFHPGKLGKNYSIHTFVPENLDIKIKFKYSFKTDESEKAWKIKFLNGFEEWFPKSKCILIKDYLYVPKWLVLKKDMKNKLKEKFNRKNLKIISTLGKRVIEI